MSKNDFGLFALVVLATPCVAAAQVASPVQTAQTTANPAAQDDTTTVDEIVVTAQRRSENLQTVPLSVTALSAERLAAAGVTSTQDLTQVTPGLLWARSSNNSQPTIRGIGSRNGGVGDEPNVATYIDGVYQPEQYGTIFELANVQQVEVLKGPQGTLFGRNATGGAINVTTKAPSFVPTGDLSATYGDFNSRKGSVYLSGPLLGDKLAGGIAAVVTADDGYVHNVFLDVDQASREVQAIRGSLLWEPTERASVRLNAYYTGIDDNTTYSYQPLNGNTQARRAANPANIPINILIPTAPYTTATGFVPENKIIQRGADLRTDYDFDTFTVRAIASYQTGHSRVHSDVDASPLAINFTDQNIRSDAQTQEIVASSKAGSAWQWVAGVNAFQADSVIDPLNSNGTQFAAGQSTTALSAFGELTYDFGDRLFFTGGLRYGEDEKTSHFRSTLTTPEVSNSHTWDNLSGRAVVRYVVRSGTNIYGSFSQGYKSGTFNATSLAGATTPANPEEIDAFEVGVKSDITRRIRLNAAAFRYNYTDLQVTVINTLGNGAIVSGLQNAPKAEVNGLEITSEFAATADLNLNFGLSLLDTEMVEFKNASVTVPGFFVNGLPAGNVSVARDVSGNQLIRAPKYTVSLGFRYEHPLADGVASVTGNIFHSDSYFLDLLNRINQPAYTLVNATVSWTAPDTRTRIAVTGQNLTDERYAAAMFSSTINDNYSFARPRWFGVTVGYAF